MTPAELEAIRAEYRERIESAVSTALGPVSFRDTLTDQQAAELAEDLIGQSDAINGIYQAGGIDHIVDAVRVVSSQRICGAP